MWTFRIFIYTCLSCLMTHSFPYHSNASDEEYESKPQNNNRCNVGFYRSKNGSCLKIPEKLGDYCEDNSHCSALILSICENDKCSCKNGTRESPEGSCVNDTESYRDCTTDIDCKPNSFCYGNDDTQKGKCKCLDGFELLRNTTYYECLPRAELGMDCINDKQCHIVSSELAFCDENKKCRCQDIAQPYPDGICYLKIKLGDICLTDANCYLSNNDWGYCVAGYCTCPIGKRPSSDKLLCISTKRMGEECVADEECQWISNARCREVCRCAVGYVLSRDGNSCDKAATMFGQNCTHDAHCGEYLKESICRDGHCWCQDGFHGYGNRCMRTIAIGDRCSEDAQCISNRKLELNVKCQNNTCVCLFGEDGAGSCKIEKIQDNNSAFQLSITLTLNVTFMVLAMFWMV